MVIVSHDREFLDRVCNKIVDAEGGMCTEYDGNYSRFLELKKSKLLLLDAKRTQSMRILTVKIPYNSLIQRSHGFMARSI